MDTVLFEVGTGDRGVIDGALLSVIRRWHLREGLAIREMARRTGLSRNTIRKYLSSGEVEPKYPAREGASKLDAFASKLATWLARETTRGVSSAAA